MRAGALLQARAAEFVAGAAGLDGAAFAIQSERGLIVTMSLAVLHFAIDGGPFQTEIVNAGQLDLILGRQQSVGLLLAGVAVAQLFQFQRLGQQRPVVEQAAGNIVNQSSLEQFSQ